MEKTIQMYEGKAKKVFATNDPEYCIVSYKDDATAFNGLKKGTILGKGAINNRVTNLRYDTETENQLDLYRIGKKCGKLTVDQARDVKRRLERGESKNSISKIYGISRTAVHYIAKGEHFGWLQ